MARTPRAVIYPSTERCKNKQRKKGFRFKLVAKNGETISSSELYTQKHNLIKTLDNYFPNFEKIEE